MKKLIIGVIAALTSLSVFAGPNEAATNAAYAAARKTAVMGPAKVSVAGQAEIAIPKGYAFIPKTEAAAIMRSMGNLSNTNLEGMIQATDTKINTDGFYVIEHTKDGFINDSDAKDLDADAILKDYQESTEEGNKERVTQGFTPFVVSGWTQKPVYDAAKHKLSWALILRDKGAVAGPDDTVNYETRILGRDGVLSVTWVAPLSELNGAGKAQADDMAAAVTYVDGKKYENYSASAGDKVAQYGLAALITGVAVKKLGILAAIGVFLAKFAKIGLLLLVGGFAGIKKFFKRTPKATVSERREEAETNFEVEKTKTLNEASQQSDLTDRSKL